MLVKAANNIVIAERLIAKYCYSRHTLLYKILVSAENIVIAGNIVITGIVITELYCTYFRDPKLATTSAKIAAEK